MLTSHGVTSLDKYASIRKRFQNGATHCSSFFALRRKQRWQGQHTTGWRYWHVRSSHARTKSQANLKEELSACRHFVNLTNGLEAIPFLQELGLQYSFVRIQSTLFEQQHFNQVLNCLDSNLLMELALGSKCIIYDYGSRDREYGNPRAIWYGIAYIRYALEWLWLNKQTRVPLLRGYNVSKLFEDSVRNKLTQSAERRVKYFKRFAVAAGTERIRLEGIYNYTMRDDDVVYYQQLSQQHMRRNSSYYTTSANSGIVDEGTDNTSDQYFSYILSDSSIEELREEHGLQLFRRSLTNVEYERMTRR